MLTLTLTHINTVYTLWNDEMRTYHFFDIIPQNTKSQIIQKSANPKLRGIVQNKWPFSLMCQGDGKTLELSLD